jgi:drug/metabolite transporter (DMT)-like permease
MEKRRPYPEVIVVVASAAWGLFWIPLRAFEQHGLNPGWATVAQFVAPLAILVPFALVRLLRGKPTGVAQFRSGLLIGAAVALYLESLLLTDVARALILFYAMPAWGTILEVVVMGIASAALLAGEPFGAPQAIGAALVIGAGLVEVIGNARAAPADAVVECTTTYCLSVGSCPPAAPSNGAG